MAKDRWYKLKVENYTSGLENQRKIGFHCLRIVLHKKVKFNNLMLLSFKKVVLTAATRV